MATVGLIAAAQPVDCEGGGGYGAGAFACEFRHPQNVHISQTHKRLYGEERIIGKLEYHCREQIQRHTVHIALERQTRTGWRERKARDDHSLPPPDGKMLEARITLPCANGVWRSKVIVTSVYEGKTYRSEPTYSKPNRITCGKP